MCGPQFNSAITRMTQFGVGMIMAGIFTLQLMPILVAIPPAMVRSSVMMLVHPAISRERDTGKQKQLREKLMIWLHLHASKREQDASSGLMSRSSSCDSFKSSLLSMEKVTQPPALLPLRCMSRVTPFLQERNMNSRLSNIDVHTWTLLLVALVSSAMSIMSTFCSM